jgi:hypothetical protein
VNRRAALLAASLLLPPGLLAAAPAGNEGGPSPPIGSAGSGGITIGAAITGSCGNGYAIYNNGGLIGCIALSGSGTVTTVSVASANGFAGTVANPTTIPAITVTTTVTGLMKGNGTAASAATAGTDYISPAGGTFTGEIITAASASGGAGFNLPPGLAPTSPANGDMWSTSAGLYVRIAGTTVGPLLAGNQTITASGDCTGSGTTTLALTCTKTNGTLFGALATVSAGTGVATAAADAVNTSGGFMTSAAPDNKTIVFASNALSTTALDTSHSGSFSSWTLGGQDTMSASGTATLPTLASGQSFTLITGSGATATLSLPGGVTLAGAVFSQSTLPPQSFLSCVYNSSSVYDCASGLANALSNLTGLGSNVGTALGNALSSAGGVSSTIASGTSALGTGAISSATCATVVTTTATNAATTDVIWWGFNGDPTGVTGYAAATAGMLTIIAYPSSGNVNFKVCNNTAGSITPGAITLNWRVIR